MQAVLNVSQDNDEFIKSYLVSYNKVSLLVGVVVPRPLIK